MHPSDMPTCPRPCPQPRNPAWGSMKGVLLQQAGGPACPPCSRPCALHKLPPCRACLAVTAASGKFCHESHNLSPYRCSSAGCTPKSEVSAWLDRQLTLPQALPTATNWPVRRVPCFMMTVATGPCPLSREASTTTPSAARLVLAFSSSRSACRQPGVHAVCRQGGALRGSCSMPPGGCTAGCLP